MGHQVFPHVRKLGSKYLVRTLKVLTGGSRVVLEGREAWSGYFYDNVWWGIYYIFCIYILYRVFLAGLDAGELAIHRNKHLIFICRLIGKICEKKQTVGICRDRERNRARSSPCLPGGVLGGLYLDGTIIWLSGRGVPREGQKCTQPTDEFYAPERGLHHFHP